MKLNSKRHIWSNDGCAHAVGFHDNRASDDDFRGWAMEVWSLRLLQSVYLLSCLLLPVLCLRRDCCKYEPIGLTLMRRKQMRRLLFVLSLDLSDWQSLGWGYLVLSFARHRSSSDEDRKQEEVQYPRRRL